MFNAGPGYDLATGLGSIDLNLLATTWSNGLASTTTVTANPAATAPSGTVQLTASVQGTGGRTPTGSVPPLVDGVTGLNTAILAAVTGPGERSGDDQRAGLVVLAWEREHPGAI